MILSVISIWSCPLPSLFCFILHIPCMSGTNRKLLHAKILCPLLATAGDRCVLTTNSYKFIKNQYSGLYSNPDMFQCFKALFSGALFWKHKKNTFKDTFVAILKTFLVFLKIFLVLSKQWPLKMVLWSTEKCRAVNKKLDYRFLISVYELIVNIHQSM
jgi:hypothetical protein